MHFFTSKVCTESIGSQYVILMCGHPFCEHCILAMMKHAKRDTLKCPTCRTRVNIEEISYVNDEFVQEDKKEDLVEVKGSWGSKIEAVVRQVLLQYAV